MDSGLQRILEPFTALGGIAKNICQREGEFGRGIFPVDSTRSAKIMTPKNLLIRSDNLNVNGGEIVIKDKACYSTDEVEFLEAYYNEYSWGSNGNSDSAAFLKFIKSLTEPIKKQLLYCGFIDANLLSSCDGEEHLLTRFIRERAVRFGDHYVLAPVWEFVNHSSFVPPLRIAPYGVETPPIEPGSSEILFKYGGKNSSIAMWNKYGFACSCIVAYSIPFKINIGNQSLAISCSGQLGLASKEMNSFSVNSDTLSIKSLPVGCISVGLPFECLKSIFSSVGLSIDIAKIIFSKVRELNIKARRDLIDNLHGSGLGVHAELYKALTYELELIESSLIG